MLSPTLRPLLCSTACDQRRLEYMTHPRAWSDIRLMPPVQEAVLALGWQAPTAVQAASMPPMLRGGDVAIQGATGTGKTAAFVIPIVQRIVTERSTRAEALNATPMAMILVPSVELAEQTVEVVEAIARYVKPRIAVDSACDPSRPISSASDIMVGTPAAVAQLLKRNIIPVSLITGLRVLVIDEADVLVAMQSLTIIQRLLPPTALQTILVSATLNEGVATIKDTLLRNPTTVKLTEEDDDDGAAGSKVNEAESSGVVINTRVLKVRTLQHHYLVATDDAHNYTLLYALFRLNYLTGKTLIFVDEEDHTYKLQHFLEQLSVPTLVYDATLPINVRLDTLKRFQRNKAGALICTDATLESAERLQVDLSVDDKESFGLTRGVDFHNVKNVILFDGIHAPSALAFSEYIHRAGRTGRAGKEGQVITLFTVTQAQHVVHGLREYLKTRGESYRAFKDLDRAAAARMQYRVDSALANVTRNATRKLRVASVASEIARSQYLSTHMTDRDTSMLRKIVQKVKRKVTSDRDLVTVPQYMGIKKVDTVDAYRTRVKAEHPQNREEVFKRLTEKQERDPLRQIVRKVKERTNKARRGASEPNSEDRRNHHGEARKAPRPAAAGKHTQRISAHQGASLRTRG